MKMEPTIQQLSTKINFYDEKTIKQRLRKTWKSQTGSDYKEGFEWYKQAHEYAQHLADTYKVPLIKVSGTIAALSPMVKWDDNQVRTENYYQTGKANHFSTQQKKVELINSLSNPSVEDVGKILNGLKTVNFFESIYNPSCRKPFTIDRWMIRIYAGGELPAISDKQYQFLKEVSLKEARRLKMVGSSYQAVLWCAMRNKS